MAFSSKSDSSQAAALSRVLRKAGWSPCPSDSPRRYEAGLTVRRGVLGTGATLTIRAATPRRLMALAATMVEDLGKLGYGFDEPGEPEPGFDGCYWIMFHRVKKTEKKASGS